MAVKDAQYTVDNGTDFDVIHYETNSEMVITKDGGNVEKALNKKAKKRINTSKEVKYIAHRGLSGVAPENTIVAIEKAGRAKFWGVEFDIRLTSDGEWILMHDSTIDRTTNGTGTVSNLTLSQIKSYKIDAGKNYQMHPNMKAPTLKEALKTCNKWGLTPLVEVKDLVSTANFNYLLSILEETNYIDNCFIISSNSTVLQNIRNLNPSVYLQLVNNITQANLNFLLELTNAGICCSYASATLANIQLAHNNDIEVTAWTVNDYNIAKDLVDNNIDYVESDIIGGVI